MPRITPLRILCLVVLAWLALVFAWLFLPSPQIPRALRSHYIQQTLGSGEAITTVHDWSVQEGECAAYAIDWILEPKQDDDSVILHVGEARINLTDHIIGRHSPYLSFPITARVRSGDLGHIINMPWFDYADANLFHHQMHGFPGDLSTRVLTIPATKEVQIWKDSPSWRSWNTFSDPSELDEERRAVGLLASFSNLQTVKGARASISGIVVSDVKGRLPSKTYRLRSAILEVIAPTLMILFVLLEFVILPAILTFIGPCIAIYAVLVLVCWIGYGQPPFREWASRFFLTRGLFRQPTRNKRRKRTWGLTGPVLDQSGSDTDDERKPSVKKPHVWMPSSNFRSSFASASEEKANHRWIGHGSKETV